MPNPSLARPFPSPGTLNYDIVRVTQALLKREIAAALFAREGDERVLDALDEIVTTTGRNLGPMLSPVLTRRDMKVPDDVIDAAARLVGDRAVVRGDEPFRRGSARTGTAARYVISAYLTGVRAGTLTPGYSADEFRVTGGYTYRGTTASMPAWQREFRTSESAGSTNDHLPHLLLSEPIPEGPAQLTMTLTPTEEDVMSADAARAIATLASLLMAIGVDLLAGMAVTTGQPVAPGRAALTPEAQQLIREHAVPAVVGAIHQALGPELFMMPLMQVDTTWTPDTEVEWRSWGWYAYVPTTPPASTGPDRQTAADLRVDQMRVVPDASNVLHTTVIPGGGTYFLDVGFVVTSI